MRNPGASQLRTTDVEGHELDAGFAVLGDSDGGFALVLESRSGRSGSDSERNPDYFAALTRILALLGSADAVLNDATVDSSRVQDLSLSERRIPLTYPVRLAKVDNFNGLRTEITSGQRPIGRGPNAKKSGGNNHKRLRLTFSIPGLNGGLDAVTDLLTAAVPVAGSASGFVPYKEANEAPEVNIERSADLDRERRERGLAGHAATQNALAERVREAGLTPESPESGGFECDIASDSAVSRVVGEVKSLTGLNVTRQIRMGLGQALHYRHDARHSHANAEAILAVEREVDQYWVEVCAEVGVALTWPPEWPNLERFGIPPGLPA